MSLDQKDRAVCPICHSGGTLYREFGLQSLYRCSGCASLFYFPYVSGGWGSLYEPLESCPFYVERGANLLFYTEVLHYLHEVLGAQSWADLGRPPEALEVGCSYGFLIDIAQWRHGWNMAGIDPDPCAAQGRRDLGLEITQTELEEMPAKDKYDVLISIETTEHVHDLRQHFSCMARMLRNIGLLILTTPDASHGDLGPNLWPGKHHVIFSQSGLARLLNEVGMTHHCFFGTSIPEILAVVASREPFPTAVASGPTPGAMDMVMRTTLDYLRFKVSNTNHPALLVRGLHFRLFELLVNLGRYSEAEPIGQSLDGLLGLEPGHTSHSSLERAVHAMMDAPDSRNYLESGPGCLAPYLFYKGMLYLNHKAEYSEASEFFGYAARLFKKEVDEFDLTHFRTFLRAAESHEKLARLRAQKPTSWYRRLFSRTAWWRRS
jgi:SAM-dependent methyltransferase